MFKIKTLWICVVIVGAVFSFKSFAQSAQEAKEFFKKIEKTIYPDNVVYVGEMNVHRPKKDFCKKIKVYLKGAEKSLVEFLSPPQESGTRILMISNNTWMFLPSVEKVIRLSGRINVTGGDFIYDDILRAKLTIDYEAISVIKGEKNMVLSLRAKTNMAQYYQIKIIFNPENYLPIKQEFYTRDGGLLKVLTYSELKHIGGKLIPTKFVMELANSEDYKTTIKIIDYSDVYQIPERVFTQEYLKKGL